VVHVPHILFDLTKLAVKGDGGAGAGAGDGCGSSKGAGSFFVDFPLTVS